MIMNDICNRHRSIIISLLLLILSIIPIVTADDNLESPPTTVKYLAFTPYWGWSNQLMELKTMATMAKATRRTLVVPKYALGRQYTNSTASYQLKAKDCYYAADDKFTNECDLFEDLIDLERLHEFVPVIREEEFLFQNSIRTYDELVSYEKIHFGVDFSNKTIRMSHRVRWVDEHLGYEYNSIENNEKEDENQWCFRGTISVRTCMRSIHELSANENMLLVFPEYHSFGVGRIRSKERGKQYKYDNDVHRFISPSKKLQEFSKNIINILPTDYVALHLRRGDFLTETWAKEHVKDIGQYAISLFEDASIGKNRLVYIATDEIDENVLLPFRILNATFLFDFLNVTASGTKGKFWHLNISIPNKQLSRSYLEQLICIGSNRFFPQKASTFSRYIDMVKKSQWVYLAHGFSLQTFRNQIKSYSKERRGSNKNTNGRVEETVQAISSSTNEETTAVNKKEL